MVNRILVAGFLCLSISNIVYAENDAQQPPQLEASSTIRFYKINKHKQTSKIGVSKKKTSQTGCHNFRRSPRVLTLVQTGFESCSVFTQKNCPAETLVKASHSKSDGFAKSLSEGHAWYIEKQTDKDTRGVKLRSWSCN